MANSAAVMDVTETETNQLCVNSIRFLAADAAQKAGSGHPGTPMGAADMAFVLWDDFLKFNPDDPTWPDRDRFVLSAGHACLLQYSLLHLYGYAVSLADIKNYRQWGSLTPGHPEYRHTPGVEVTSGPLGQGFANAVGMALAERFLAARFNRDDFTIVDHHTYCLCSDGDLMEGIASEAASFAGFQKLGKLIALYDDNRITIGGRTDITFTEDVGKRFEAYGWHVQRIDGHDREAVHHALSEAKDETSRPSIIIARTHIGYGSPEMQDTPEVHGAPLGDENVRKAKLNLGWPTEPDFYVPAEVYEHCKKTADRGRDAQREWKTRMSEYRKRYPESAAEFERLMSGELPAGWDKELPTFTVGEKPIATREASGKVLNAIALRVHELIGGSADLEPSNKTLIKDGGSQSAALPLGRNIHFGVREHAMGGICNGIAYHGGLRPYNGTFLIFSDYQRPSVRLAALAGLKVVFIYTHDSIGVGGDGPTHQPIEHLHSLRAMPNLVVIRPADANETRVAWHVAMTEPGPVALILTRQNVPVLAGLRVDDLTKGAYIAREADGGKPQAIIIATGSELSISLDAAEQLNRERVPVRVVNMPSWELFERQPVSYRDQILPRAMTKRLAVEAGATLGWWKYVGLEGDVLGVDRFGASAPEARIFKEFGFTPENIVARVKALL